MMVKRIQIIKDIEKWFDNPESLFPICLFIGVIVYERKKKIKNGVNRIGIPVGSISKKILENSGNMPPGSRPSKDWDGARIVGFAKTKEEAIRMLNG